jgi:hypothetical protein
MSNLIELYQKHCPYQITNNIQQLEFDIDIETLRKELFKFIIDNKFGFSTVSLRLSKNETNYISPDEILESGAINPYGYQHQNLPSNSIHNKEYINWHPDLLGSYTASLVPEIEKHSGLHIGRIRLGWLQPDSGYCMHADLEPMRLHIPLFTNNLAYIIHDNNLYHMEYGKLYHLITTNIHTAWNFGSLPRLHLIFSTYADDQIDSEIEKLTKVQTGESNFSTQIKDQGVDSYSLIKLLEINDSVSRLNSADKLDSIRNIKKIIDLVTKN